MGEGGSPEAADRQVPHHRRLQDRHHLSALNAKNGGAEEPVCRRVDDRLHEAARLVDLQGAGHAGHRHLRHRHVEAPAACLLFGEAHAAELWVGEEGVSDEAVLGGAVPTVEPVVLEHAVVVVGDVREGGAAGHVPDCVDAVGGGGEPGVNLHIALLGGRHARRAWVQRVGVRAPARGHQELIARDAGRGVVPLQVRRDRAARLLDGRHARLVEETDPVLPQNIFKRPGHVGVLTAEDVLAPIDNRHLRPEPPEHLPELEPDVPAAEDEQVARHRAQLHDGGRGQEVYRIEPVDGRNGGTGAGVDHNAVRREGAGPAVIGVAVERNLHGVRIDEPAVALNEVQGVFFFDAASASRPKHADDVALALADRLQVDTHVAGLHAVVPGAAGEVGHAGAGDHGLGGRAAPVDTRAPHVPPFEEGDVVAGFGDGAGEGPAALTGADDDEVVGDWICHFGKRSRAEGSEEQPGAGYEEEVASAR
ncbi:hypothetical protein SARU107417_07980 [Salinibacter ruber]